MTGAARGPLHLSRFCHDLHERAAGDLADLEVEIILSVNRELLAGALGGRADFSQGHGGTNANEVVLMV